MYWKFLATNILNTNGKFILYIRKLIVLLLERRNGNHLFHRVIIEPTTVAFGVSQSVPLCHDDLSNNNTKNKYKIVLKLGFLTVCVLFTQGERNVRKNTQLILGPPRLVNRTVNAIPYGLAFPQKQWHVRVAWRRSIWYCFTVPDHLLTLRSTVVVVQYN